MVDLFKLFRVETKEDIYTYCLLEMIKGGTNEFRRRVGLQFGFCDNPFEVVRRSFTNIESSIRKQITPDFILYNENQVSIVESKMFSSEGDDQTSDYEKNKEMIKRELGVENANVKLFFLTLSGISSRSEFFKQIKWTDFYESILLDVRFQDECLEVIRKTILNQVDNYRRFEADIKVQKYSDLFQDDTYWITPLTLFASGTYDNVWQAVAGKERFNVSNFPVTGHGHSEFSTDLYKDLWRKQGTGLQDNVHLFIRIEWYYGGPIVWLGWEYYERSTKEYIPVSNIKDPIFKRKAIDYLLQFKMIWENENNHPLNIKTTKKAENSIKALKCELRGDCNVDETINQIKSVVSYYSMIINKVMDAFITKEDYLYFSEKKYRESERTV